jgi:hypothetical protein
MPSGLLFVGTGGERKVAWLICIIIHIVGHIFGPAALLELCSLSLLPMFSCSELDGGVLAKERRGESQVQTV